MHEYSIVQALLARVEREARARGASAVLRVNVSVGVVSGVEPELLATAYEFFRAHTLCERADLNIRRIEERWACPACMTTIESGAVLRCGRCGGPARLIQGGEIMLERIEMEVP
jgi:hydrogenase nickel incorporation protein HypA/HybF